MTSQTSLTNGSTFNSTVIKSTFSNLIRNFPQYDTIPCNTYRIIVADGMKISVYRYCNNYNVDWLVIFSVSEWNYIGNMIIAIICAIIGSLMVIGIGGIFGVISATVIVKPFKNLIEQFENVSSMDLDIQMKTSSLREVSLLQGHFIVMVERMKQYRAFIPSHLLSRLEGASSNVKESVQKERGEDKLETSFDNLSNDIHQGS